MNSKIEKFPKDQSVTPSNDERMLDEIKHEDDNFVPLSNTPDLTDEDENACLKIINESNDKKEVVVPVMPLV